MAITKFCEVKVVDPLLKYKVSDNEKYAVEVINNNIVKGVTSAAAINAKYGISFGKYKQVKPIDAALYLLLFTGVTADNVKRDNTNHLKVFYIAMDDGETAVDGTLEPDGTPKVYYSSGGNFIKAETEKEWTDELLNPIRAAIQEVNDRVTALDAKVDAGFAEAAAQRAILQQNITINSNRITATNDRIDVTNANLSAAVARIVTLENNANIQADVLYNHNTRLGHIESRAVDGYTIATSSTGQTTWGYVGAGAAPIISSSVYVTPGSGGGGGPNPTPSRKFFETGYEVLGTVKSDGRYIIDIAPTASIPTNSTILPLSESNNITNIYGQNILYLTQSGTLFGSMDSNNLAGRFTASGYEILIHNQDGTFVVDGNRNSIISGNIPDSRIIGSRIQQLGGALIVDVINGTLVFGSTGE